jgi:hypothetical protein
MTAGPSASGGVIKRGESMDEASLESLRARIDEYHTWPSAFLFKFIVPAEELPVLMKIFEGHPVTTRPSRHGKYVSLTAEIEMTSGAAVIAVYREAGKIKGCISL